MRLGLVTGYSGAQMGMPMDVILEAEKSGFDSVWTAEAYGSDAIVPLTWIAALTKKIRLGTGIVQMPARTPAMTAMTAMTLDALSGGRFILGIGPSGPQVVEGWHGVPYGKPLKSILHGRKDLPIYTASISPKGIALAAEIADGVIPVWMNPERWDIYDAPLKEGFARTGGKKSLANFDVAPFVSCVMGNDIEKCRMPIRAMLALYIGGMGARQKNFYNDYAKRLNYEGEAVKIQDLYLTGKKNEAMALVPNKLVDEVALVGPKERIKERLAAWKASPVKTMLINTNSIETVRALADLAP